MKKILALFSIPGMTQEQYDNVMKDLTEANAHNQKSREHHFAAPKKDGWFVMDVWNSAEALMEFSGTLVPILIKNGVTPTQPEILPLHNEVD